MIRESATVTVNNTDTCLIVTINGDIDHHSARTIRERIDSELFFYRPPLLVLNLKNVDFMDSSGLGLILGRQSRAHELGCAFKVINCSPRTRKIFELAGLERIVDIVDTE
ncbi:MAG: anti-sigma factor antagonist [Clostridiales bacterium]|nr:anti-sigma factor antagonist [Clostridiales bacterium]